MVNEEEVDTLMNHVPEYIGLLMTSVRREIIGLMQLSRYNQ
jgi:hypothetical protein